MILTPDQCRVGRAHLRWTVRQLQAAAGITYTTITRFEMGAQDAKSETQQALRDALVAAGVEFGEDGWIRLRPEVAAEKKAAEEEPKPPAEKKVGRPRKRTKAKGKVGRPRVPPAKAKK